MAFGFYNSVEYIDVLQNVLTLDDLFRD